MAWEGCQTFEKRGDARRLLWSRLVIDHRLKARDPLTATDGAWEEEVSRLLLDEQPVPMEVAHRLIAG